MVARPTEPPRSPTEEDALQPFRITPRVLAILSAVGQFGVMTSEQIARLDGGSRQKVTRILQRCVELQLLRRPGPNKHVAFTSFFDTRPRPFALTAKGARCLSEAGMPLNAKPSRSAVLLQHNIEVAETMAFGFHAAAAQGSLRLIDHHDLLPLMPPATRELRKPFCLYTTVQPADFPHLGRLLKEPTEIGVEPDRLFSIVRPDNTGWTRALEIDCANEDITARRIKGKATFFRKQLGYYAAWLADKHTLQCGDFAKSFRVLTVTTSVARIHNMLATQQEITRGSASGLFLYSTAERVNALGALGPAWMSAKRDHLSPLDGE